MTFREPGGGGDSGSGSRSNTSSSSSNSSSVVAVLYMTQAIGTGELIPLSKQSAHRRHHSLINQTVCCHYFLPSLSPARGASSSCPRFNLASDCARAPVPTSWFLPHADLHLAIEHSQSQELDWELTAGQCHRCTIFVLIPATPEDISFPATTASFNNTNYCVVVLKCLALSTTLILANWTELRSMHLGGV